MSIYSETRQVFGICHLLCSSLMTYVSILVHVIVGELHLVEGDVVLHPVTAASGTVWVEIKSENISVNISKC